MPATIEQRKQRWQRFWNADASAPFLFVLRYPPDESPPRPLPWPDLMPQRTEWAWQQYTRQMARLEWLDDDSLPYLDCLSGTEIFAEAFGCQVHYPRDNNPFALPLVHSAWEAAKLKVPSLDVPALKRMFDMADELVRRAGRGTLLRPVDIQSPMDVAALIWDKNDFFAAMVETPTPVKELAYKVRQLQIAFLEEWFRRYGREFIAHYPEYYMPQGLTLSEDEIGAVSPPMFEELFLPELTELSTHFGGIGIHCCANAEHQWAGLARVPGLRLLNICQPRDVCGRAISFFAGKVAHWHSWQGDGDPWTWPSQYPAGVRAVFDVRAGVTREQAIELAAKMREACCRS